ncbi:hypothetical protein [Cupriavidus lacunae]|uniref:Uncharacterized protein n=1 Tax=Cupriavidus lacunae TaxID=2666307 RepID=A0A370NH80_9BURK|nr:hypothetical protein [Cupriavidus lacunae]RDK04954.1 hypothetical protein DN412_39745 [Cupriavidus lacunae]
MKSSVKEELMAALESSTSMNAKTPDEIAMKQRNIAIVLSFYGFGKAIWPTLEDLAQEFKFTSRERVRQIIQKAFKQGVDHSDLTAARQCAQILEARESWHSEVYIDALSEAGIDVPRRSIQGLLNLMRDMGLAVNYRAYTPDFREMTRSLVEEGLDIVLIREGEAKEKQAAFKVAIEWPGLVGVANLREIAEKYKWSADLYAAIHRAVAYSPTAWSWQNGGDFWYTFEGRQTTMRTYHEKVFSVIEWAKPSHLAEVYENAMHSRSVATASRPPVPVIEQYLKTSPLFQRSGELIRYDGHHATLTDIEHAMVDFFKKHSEANFPTMRDYLSGRGFSDAYVKKAVFFSCVVHVDKTGGRHNYIFRCVQGAVDSGAKTTLSAYEVYRERLRRLYEEATATDADQETQRRLEQGILQDWLFASKDTEYCAICGDLFHVSALVTAHKKKRALCTTAERLDPHIVMPACTLGCDFLYEREYVHVVGGVVQVNAKKASGTTEYKRAESLAGRKLLEKWHAGKDEYFRQPGDSQ